MSKHITVRMAWHDNAWNGTICQHPSANSYCVGSHSLLSDRIARDKRTDLEDEKRGLPLDVLLPEYMPPCYWTSAAFATQPVKVVHDHPFYKFRGKKKISEELPLNSVFTWPFRLSLTHSKAARKKDGQYPRDLDARVDEFVAQLQNGHSLVFFYLNYDNPVSGDEYRYALVGCAMVADTCRSDEYQFTPEELDGVRSKENMQHFPTRNWAVRLQYDYPKSGVRLPYHEYLEYVAEHPAEEEKLEEMRVLIEEPSLLPGFKYVSELLNDDRCLHLLYKLRRSFRAVERHGIINPGDALARINSYIGALWRKRGLYPGLGSVVSQLASLSEGATDFGSTEAHAMVQAVTQNLKEGEDGLAVMFELLQGDAVPAYLNPHKKVLRRARRGLSDYGHLSPLLRRLSFFALTPRQVGRIISPGGDGLHAFHGRNVAPDAVAANPYLLCENYVPATDDDDERTADRDRGEATDGPIDYATIDLGMFCDEDHIEPNDELQTLSVACPERLRAFVIESLHGEEERGHTYASIDAVLREISEHPLMHRDKMVVGKERLLSERARMHFAERLHLESFDGEHFIYLRETWHAEKVVERVVQSLMQAPDHAPDFAWIDGFLDEQVAALKGAPGFDEALFRSERRRLIQGCLARRLFVVTGRPGAGKTRALRDVLAQLHKAGERVVVLAPTGKATLRLAQEAQCDQVQTIDRWIYSSGLGVCLKDLAALEAMPKSAKFEPLDTLVIDEMSMVHLPHLAVILRALEVHQPGSTKRVILVGDENQLPPIGCGRPFYDIISHLREDAGREDRHTVRLRTNCRQQHDSTVLEAAYLFAGKNRYSTELWPKILQGGRLSPWLNIESWKDPHELNAKLLARIEELLKSEKGGGEVGFNLLLNLYDKGFVPKNDTKALALDRAQVLTPYRTGHGGALTLNDVMRRAYRPSSWPPKGYKATAFAHSDKIIRISNYYGWDSETKRPELHLSNGSIGVLCDNKDGRKAYFPESKWAFD